MTKVLFLMLSSVFMEIYVRQGMSETPTWVYGTLMKKESPTPTSQIVSVFHDIVERGSEEEES